MRLDEIKIVLKELIRVIKECVSPATASPWNKKQMIVLCVSTTLIPWIMLLVSVGNLIKNAYRKKQSFLLIGIFAVVAIQRLCSGSAEDDFQLSATYPSCARKSETISMTKELLICENVKCKTSCSGAFAGESYYEKGKRYILGNGVEYDACLAETCFRKGSENGDKQCLAALSLLYCWVLDGVMVYDSSAYFDVVAFTRESAENGNSQAQVGLGLAYSMGIVECGTPNNKKADYWFRQAIGQGNSYGTLARGVVFMKSGKPVEGLGLIRSAAECGNEIAQKFLKSNGL